MSVEGQMTWGVEGVGTGAGIDPSPAHPGAGCQPGGSGIPGVGGLSVPPIMGSALCLPVLPSS